MDVVDGLHSARSVREVYGYEPGWGVVGPGLREEITRLMAPEVSDNQPQAT